ncbi:MAG TPA: phosphoribosylamine--glycine ligase [Thermoanaerobaculia bacterium]|nr:phosphoribosylamine--glycine ligase [Thermoanaerobaculia bacterium]
MKVLVVGGGGREHALCWKLRQSPLLRELYCAPGNPGIGEIAELVPVGAHEVQRLADLAAHLRADLTVVGPEVPLTLGLVDELARRGLPVFGPSRRAAELEGSKVFAKRFMERHGLPTSPFEVVEDAAGARRARQSIGLPLVLKADGLAAGKGVLIAHDEAAFEAALATLFEDRRFGQAARQVVVEPFLEGEEVSFMALADGERLLAMATSKDYKRIGEGDTGPNTGGMGAHSPSHLLSGAQCADIMARVMRPAIAGLAAEGRRFCGVLYAGLMMTAAGPRVLEFNVRFGDPEAQVLLLRIEDDLLPILASGAAGRFDVPRLRFRKAAAACVVLASSGYPDQPVPGDPIDGIERAAALPGVEIFHAGTAEEGERLVTAGGRVLNVCATAPHLADALRRAYAAAAEIQWPGQVMRGDVGRRVLELGQAARSR